MPVGTDAMSWASIAVAAAPPLGALLCCLSSASRLRTTVAGREKYGADRAAARGGDPGAMADAADWLASCRDMLSAEAMLVRAATSGSASAMHQLGAKFAAEHGSLLDCTDEDLALVLLQKYRRDPAVASKLAEINRRMTSTSRREGDSGHTGGDQMDVWRHDWSGADGTATPRDEQGGRLLEELAASAARVGQRWIDGSFPPDYSSLAPSGTSAMAALNALLVSWRRPVRRYA